VTANLENPYFMLVGAVRFELAISWSRTTFPACWSVIQLL